MSMTQTGTSKLAAAGAAGSRAWLGALLLFGLAIAVGSIELDHLPRNDELYTVLAARGWLTHGFPRIGDGVYDRAPLHTMLVATFFHTFGESLTVARLPSLIAGALLVVAVFFWVRSVAGDLAAWISGLLLALSPLGIQLEQYARFYTLHALVFWLGSIGLYTLVERQPPLRFALPVAAGVVAAFLLAYHLQPLTVVGTLGLALWLGAAIVLPWLWAQRGRPRLLWLLGGGALLLALAALALVWSGLAQEHWQHFRTAPLHAQPRAHQLWFYHLGLVERYPILWPILPFIVFAALAARPRPALFCSCVFLTAFALLSLAAMKHFVYLFFTLPFLFVVWGIALASVGRTLVRLAVEVTQGALAAVGPGLPRRPTRALLIALGVLFLLISNGAPARVLLKPLGVSLGADETLIDWRPLAVELAPWLERASVVLTPNDVHALYYLGDYDLAVNPSRLSEVPGGQEFSLDPRTGRPVIATLDSLRLVMACRPSGLFVADSTMFPIPWGVDGTAMSDFIRQQLEPIELAPGSGLYAFHWQHDAARPAPAACAALPPL